MEWKNREENCDKGQIYIDIPNKYISTSERNAYVRYLKNINQKEERKFGKYELLYITEMGPSKRGVSTCLVFEIDYAG